LGTEVPQKLKLFVNEYLNFDVLREKLVGANKDNQLSDCLAHAPLHVNVRKTSNWTDRLSFATWPVTWPMQSRTEERTITKKPSSR